MHLEQYMSNFSRPNPLHSAKTAPDTDREPLLVVSPHLDDAVFSCASFIAGHPGSTVVTVLAGCPRHGAMSTDWDRQCGFASADEAMRVRRLEDQGALQAVSAHASWLDFCDAQYQQPVDLDRLAIQLAEVFANHAGRPWLVPLGLFHSDHQLTHEAAVRAVALASPVGSQRPIVLAYEDAPYRSMDGVLQQRLAALATNGIRATPAALPFLDDRSAKRRAVWAYASQVPLFGLHGLDDLWRPERLWRLTGGAFCDAEVQP